MITLYHRTDWRWHEPGKRVGLRWRYLAGVRLAGKLRQLAGPAPEHRYEVGERYQW